MAKVFIADAFDLRASVEDALAALGGDATIRRGERVFLKPNLTYPTHRPGVTTSPQFLRAVLQCLSDLGARVTVGEGDGGYGAWPADVAFDGHGLRAICRESGADLVNLSSLPACEVELRVRGRPYRLALPAILLDETDAFVTLPVPKVHAMTTYSGAVKNQWGCIPDNMRLKRHPDFPQLIWAINRRLAPRLVLGDGQYMLDRNGPLWGDAVYMNRVIAADDVLAFDVAVCSRLMGLDPRRIAYLREGVRHGFNWTAAVEDRSTGIRHRFVLRRTMRNRLTAFAFRRQWAVDLLWDSPIGDAMHWLLYRISGDPVGRERAHVTAMTRSGGATPMP
jgi:uncharacterized protein (DUF362 family)